MSIFGDIACLVWKTNPLYWQVWAAVRVGRAQGVIKNKQECEQLVKAGGTIAGGFEIPAIISGTLGNCACSAVFDRDAEPVVLFQHDDFGGDLQACEEGEFRADRGELDDVGNDQISSLVVAPGFKVFLAENEPENGLGRTLELGPGSHRSLSAIESFWNDRVSYVKVFRA
jgi:hypothetical protein